MTSGEPKKKPRGIGGINPYGTFGSPNDQESEHADIQTVERPGVQTARSSNVQQSSSPDMQVASSPARQTSKHPGWKQQTIYMPPALAKWLKIHAVQAELEISEIMVLALKEYQERHS